ncbi:MAG: hypothetical protein HGB28_00600 [Oscillochloris sp.]|nr:hypothetical protein [Oscillochloris sp.]
MLPEPLALDLRDSHLAVGIYLLIARNYLVHQGYIPLSTADIDAYDGSCALSRGVIVHALDRLCDEGWLIAQRQRGKKTAYLPAWGMVGGAARAWDLTIAGLDRPRTVRAVRVPRVTLDVCMGRLTPHRRHTALIDRYVTRPALSLRDVGAYGLLWAGIPSASPTLIQLGLASPAGPLPPPSWGALLARISQRPLFDADPEAPTLSARGLQRAGLVSRPAAPAPEETPLFFVPPDMIGDLIPHMIPDMISDQIDSEAAHDPAPSAAARAKTPVTCVPQTTTANLGKQAIGANEATSSPTPVPLSTDSSSSSISFDTTADARSSQTPPASTSVKPEHLSPAPPAELPTEAEQLLHALGVYPSVARRYHEFPLALIERAETIARRLSGRNSLPATIVQLLREELASPGWLRQERPDLFLGPMRDASLEEPIAEEAAACDADDDVEVAPAPPAPPPVLRAPIAPPAARVETERPAWIDAERWRQLYPIARTALAGSRIEDGEIVGSSSAITRTLRTHLSGLVARLRAPVDSPGGAG